MELIMNAANLSAAAAAFPWILVSLAHSVLGERLLLQPLFAQKDWSLGGRRSRQRIEALFRFAWHATSIAWLGLAALAFGAPLPWVLASVAGLCALLDFYFLRWHLAWPIFLFASLASIWWTGSLEHVLPLGAGATAVLLVGLSLLHVYWAAGGTSALESTLPSDSEGNLAFRPGRLMTLGVAALLLAFAGLLIAAAFQSNLAARWLVGFGFLVLAARAVGDRKYVGFTKTIRSTSFARLDDRLYTPIVVLLALGALSALVS